MGSGGSKKSSSAPVVTSQPLVNQAQAVGMRPYQAYTGNRVAGQSQTQLDAVNMIRQNATGQPWQPGMTEAAGMVRSAVAPSTRVSTSFAAPQIGIDSLLADIAKLRNPFEDSVVQGAVGDQQRSLDMAMRNQRLRGAGSQNGIRQLFAESEIQREGIDRIGRVSGDLRAQGFDRALTSAQGLATSNQGARLEALRMGQTGELANQQADQADRDRGLRGSGQLAALETLMNELRRGDAQSLYAIGQDQTNRAQAQADADYQEFLRSQGWDAQQLTAWAQAHPAAYGVQSTSRESNGIGGVLQGVGALSGFMPR